MTGAVTRQLDFRILGPVRLERAGVAVDLGRPKQRALLARLLLSRNRPVSVDRLVDDLWGDQAPARSGASLQAYVSNLRRILEPDRSPRTPATRLVTQPPGYLLVVDDDELDASRFERLAATCREHLAARDPAAARDTAEQALGLWSGAFLADLDDHDFTRADRVRLSELQQAVQETRLAAELELGRTATAIGQLEGMLADAPLRERLWELLLVALYRAGRSADALERYQQARRVLADEVGLEPGVTLRALQDAILRQDEALLGPTLTAGVAPAASAPAVSAVAASTPAAAPAAPVEPAASPTTRPPPSAGIPAGFVGREAERERLDALVASVADGRTRWGVVAGEAGVGKSRLVEVVARQAAERGTGVLWARCHQEESGPPFWLMLQLLRGLDGAADDADLVEQLGVPVAAPDGPDGEELRFRLYDAVARRVAAAARERPLLAVVDDLQWADRASLRLLTFLAVQLRDAPVYVLATLRDEPLTPEVDALMATLARQPGADRVELAGLSTAEVGELALALTGTAVDAASAARIHERTGGNAFYSAELLQLTGTGPADDAATVPSGVRDVVRRRLDQLPPDARSLLVLAAVIGVEFDLTELAAADGLGPDQVAEQLDLALARRVIVPAGVGGGEFGFSHALVRDAVIADLTLLHRQRLHARVAASLRELGGVAPARLAHHLLEAGPLGPWAAAADAAVEAGRHAATRIAFDEAAAWFERALEAHEAHGSPDPVTHHRLLLAAGEAYREASLGLQARETLVAAMDQAEAAGDAAGMARAGMLITRSQGLWFWALFTEQPHDVLERIDRAIALLPQGDSVERAGLLATRATGLTYFPEDEAARADELSAEALAMARRVDDPRCIAETLVGRIEALWHARHVDEQLRLSEELLALPPAGRGVQVELAGKALRCQALVSVGRLADADAEHEQVVALATARRQATALAQIGWYEAARAVVRWDLPELAAANQRALELHESAQLQLGTEVSRFSMVEVLREQGRMAEAGPLIDVLVAAVADVPRTRLPWFEYLLHLHLARGENDVLRAALIESLDAEPPYPWLWLPSMWLRADAAATLGDPAIAARFAALLEPYRALVPIAGTGMSILPPVALALGRLELVVGDAARAEMSLRAALETAERFAAPVWIARTRLALAAALSAQGARSGPGAGRARDASGDEPVRLLDLAEADARRLGLDGLVAQIEQFRATRAAG